MTELTTAEAAAEPRTFNAHDCENGCGRIADVVITTLADSGVSILCSPCHLAMMVAVAQGIAEAADLDGGSAPA